ncbi:hypothetical protein Moror_11224 [Moniliophthora roreri MCA 2997]|uniref:Uncharacterized protein n=1 Tax=Moniliophthora roreri (strain MCA 2997) TaxID=1381753 RepID=V2WM56_MONRO|nr:hypothetical protein Moror_11224 [Moniliophthora roreri MCA 2997]
MLSNSKGKGIDTSSSALDPSEGVNTCIANFILQLLTDEFLQEIPTIRAAIWSMTNSQREAVRQVLSAILDSIQYRYIIELVFHTNINRARTVTGDYNVTSASGCSNDAPGTLGIDDNTACASGCSNDAPGTLGMDNNTACASGSSSNAPDTSSNSHTHAVIAGSSMALSSVPSVAVATSGASLAAPVAILGPSSLVNPISTVSAVPSVTIVASTVPSVAIAMPGPSTAPVAVPGLSSLANPIPANPILAPSTLSDDDYDYYPDDESYCPCCDSVISNQQEQCTNCGWGLSCSL